MLAQCRSDIIYLSWLWRSTQFRSQASSAPIVQPKSKIHLKTKYQISPKSPLTSSKRRCTWHWTMICCSSTSMHVSSKSTLLHLVSLFWWLVAPILKEHSTMCFKALATKLNQEYWKGLVGCQVSINAKKLEKCLKTTNWTSVLKLWSLPSYQYRITAR